MTNDLVRLVVVDDQRLICESIAALLELQPGITVVGTAVDGEDALQVIGQTLPDVVLLDVQMPRMDGITALTEIARIAPACRVIMLTTLTTNATFWGRCALGRVGISSRIDPPPSWPRR